MHLPLKPAFAEFEDMTFDMEAVEDWKRYKIQVEMAGKKKTIPFPWIS